ncbi:MAG: nickel pincer cofactor biosynthesis protein LarB [Nitrospirae bacterium]|nr:nickel pincer cofactor biosynthesis protein LarB [Nitrospirota bacterium]
MDKSGIEGFLKEVKSGKISIDEALKQFKRLHYEDLGFAKIDHCREGRNGVPEAIFSANKEIDDVVSIARSMLKCSGKFLITKATKEIHRALKLKSAKFYPRSGIITYGKSPLQKGCIVVIAAGTSDVPIAEEAAVTASYLGSKTETLYDVGVAGIHRLLAHRELIQEARVIIAVAGMEGALPSVIGGIFDKPLVAVPTSTGYGASLGGFTALFAMLNSCVPGIAVVNIDNGFGAGCLAHKINMMGLK